MNVVKYLVAALAVALLLGAGGWWYVSRPEPACADRADPQERDLCYYDALALLPPPTPAAAYEGIRVIADPIVRSAATQVWLRANPKVMGPEAARLCTLLTGSERYACERRASSPHLHR